MIGEIIKKTKVIESKKDIIITEKILSFIENLSKDPIITAFLHEKAEKARRQSIR